MALKGFENLIAACGLLHAKGLDFRCEIIGDGPLREKLQEQIVAAQLESFVVLRGSLSQAQVFEALERSDIFALASIVDGSGASDVFPTVIQEAMACARPVVSTRLAGIPETVIDGKTGLSCRARKIFRHWQTLWKNCFATAICVRNSEQREKHESKNISRYRRRSSHCLIFLVSGKAI